MSSAMTRAVSDCDGSLQSASDSKPLWRPGLSPRAAFNGGESIFSSVGRLQMRSSMRLSSRSYATPDTCNTLRECRATAIQPTQTALQGIVERYHATQAEGNSSIMFCVKKSFILIQG